MEAVSAYYNGKTFVPRRVVAAKKNQRAIITILDDTTFLPDLSSSQWQEAGVRGMFSGGNLSSDQFAVKKQFEKALEH